MFGYEYNSSSPMKCREPDLEEILKNIREDKQKLQQIDDAIVTIAKADLPMPSYDDVTKLVILMFGAVRVRKDELDRREVEILIAIGDRDKDSGTPPPPAPRMFPK